MSQTSLLADIESWGPEECQAQLRFALPKLIEFLHETEDLQTELVILQRVCQSFLHFLPAADVEKHLFKPLKGKVIHCFDNSVGKVSEAFVKSCPVEELCQLLEIGLAVIECLELCVTHVNQSSSLDPEHVHSLPPMVIHVLHGSYSHCKESSKMYGYLLSSVSGHLSSLFKRAHSLQMAFIALLDKIQLSPASSDQDINDTCYALQSLYELTQVAASLDVKITVTLWKTVSRLACQYKELLYDQLDVDRMLSTLSNDMCSAYNYLFTMVPSTQGGGDEKGFQKNVKVLGFQMKVLLMLVREYCDCLHGCIQHLYNLTLTLHTHIPPSLKSRDLPQQYVDDVQRQVTMAIDPLLSCLIPNKTFIKVVMRAHQEISEEFSLPRCLLLVSIMDSVPNFDEATQSFWTKPSHYAEDEEQEDILQAVLKAAAKCTRELSVPVTLPGVMCQGKPQREVSLHEHIVTRICGFVGCQSTAVFSHLEQLLLENVLTDNTHIAVLSIDVWCFIVRYGTADLCQEHCYVVADLLTQMTLTPSPQCCHLIMTFRRLFKFMAPEHQTEFLQKYRIEDHIGLWSVLPLSVLSLSSLHDASQHVIASAHKALSTWVTSSSRTPAMALSMIQTLRSLNNLYAVPGFSQEYPHPELHALLKDRVCEFWDMLAPVDLTCYACVSHLTAEVVRTTGLLVKDFTCKALYKVLHKLSLILEENVQASIKVAVLHCLKHLSRVFLPPSNEQKQALGEISRLFSQLLGDPNLAIKQLALETFSQFAEETQHEMVVPDTLQRNPTLQDMVVNYLNQVANNTIPELKIETIDNQVKSFEAFNKLSLSEKYPAGTWPIVKGDEVCSSPEQPLAKRQKLDSNENTESATSSDESCRKVVNSLRKGVEELQDLRGALPSWALDELRTINSHLAAMLS